MDTYLAPIEKPSGFMMKLAYCFARRQFWQGANTSESALCAVAVWLRPFLRQDMNQAKFDALEHYHSDMLCDITRKHRTDVSR